MKVAITKSDSKFERYTFWLESFNVRYEILDYKNHETDINKLDECSGLILTGGVDIYPELYCDWDTAETKGTYNPERDGFELKIIEKAVKREIPILAICRGMQIINVFYRGSLIFDLEEIRGVNHNKIAPYEDRIHEVNILPGTLLHEITNLSKAEVNSSHHQALDRLGEGLIINAKSDDGIIEGIEYSDKTGKPFFLGIQWHPERMSNFNSPVSKNIIDKFVSECLLISNET